MLLILIYLTYQLFFNLIVYPLLLFYIFNFWQNLMQSILQYPYIPLLSIQQYFNQYAFFFFTKKLSKILLLTQNILINYTYLIIIKIINLNNIDHQTI